MKTQTRLANAITTIILVIIGLLVLGWLVSLVIG